MTREDAQDFLNYFESQHGAHAILSNDLPWTVKSGCMCLHFQKSNWFGPEMSLRYRVLEDDRVHEDDDVWKRFEYISFAPSCDKLNAFGVMWAEMMYQAKLVSKQSFTFAFFPSKLDDINCVVDEARVGETFTLPCASSVAEMELKLAITQ